MTGLKGKVAIVTGASTSKGIGSAIARRFAQEGAALYLVAEGTREQLAPPYSAKKVKGVKLYEMARRGEEVPQEAKEVTVYEFAPLAGDGTEDEVPFRLSCSSGTYARTLAHDLGARLGCGAHLASLRRLTIGPFRVEDALTLGALAERLDAPQAPADQAPMAGPAEDGDGAPRPFGESLGPAWIPFDAIPLPFGEVTADSQQEQRIQHGQTVLTRDLPGVEGDWVKLVNRRRRFIAVGTITERIGTAGVGIVQPKVVFK